MAAETPNPRVDQVVGTTAEDHSRSETELEKKASPADRADFLKWIGLSPGGVVAVASALLPPASVAGPDRRLTPAGNARIKVFYSCAPLESGDLMSDLGLIWRNPSFGIALRNNFRLDQVMIDRLDNWLQAKEAAR